jgi:di/tricarboxylate transporter
MSPEAHAVAAMVAAAAALVLFTRERIPLEYTCIGVLVLLAVGFEIFPYRAPGAGPNEVLRGTDFLTGFGNEALIAICLLLMLVKGVEVSGALRPIGRLLVHVWRRNPSLALLATLLAAAFLSAFVNNTPLVVMLMPILIGVAHRIGTAPSRVLMPFCFATTMGGMTTTIGSSTNLLVVDAARRLGAADIGMFDFVVPAVLAGAAGIVYLWAIAPRWLPDRPSPLAGTAPLVFYAVIEIDDGSRFAGQALGDVMRLTGTRARIERLQRGELEIVRLPSLTLRAGDKLHVRGSPEVIKEVQDFAGATFDPGGLRRGPEQRLVEIVVTRNSPLFGKKLGELQRTTLGRLFVIGIQRSGPARMTSVGEAGDPLLRVGDVLLMQGQAKDIHDLQRTHDFLILDRAIHVPRTANAPFATTVLAVVVVTAALGLLPIMVSALGGVGIMLITRRLHWHEAWGAIDVRLVLVIVTSLALGTALMGTGATLYLAETFVAAVGDLPIPVVLSGFLLFVALLNELISNNAVAVIATPIAVAIAERLGAPVLPFVLAVLFGANAGYITPIGYQTNLLVYTTGGYRFGDFLRVGGPLQLLTWAVLSLALWWLYL